jgi:fumarate reductase flavoprotein subunit
MKKVLVFLFSLICIISYAEDYAADVVIIGGGWSGLMAGVAAGDAGLETVILEKQPAIGGGGNFLIGTNGMGRPGFLTVDEGYKLYMDYTHYVPNGSVLRALLNAVPGNIDWLRAHGVTVLTEDGLFGDRGGSSIVENFAQRIRNMENVTLLTETPAKELIIENGAVVGVIAESDGETVTVRAKNTIIAAGPIINNPEMVKKYMPYLGEGYRPSGLPGRTGDGITLALQAGAKIDPIIAMDTEAGHTMGLSVLSSDPEMITLHHVIKLPFLRVNPLGRRFMDESVFPYHREAHALTRNGNMYWIILDEKLKSDLINKGEAAMGVPPNFPPLDSPKLTRLDSALEKAIAKGYAYKANTLEELAKGTGMDIEVFKATVARQNELARKGKDDDFLKNPRYLHVYNRGPFYAFKAEHTIISTNGGIQCNDKFQVIREDTSVIPGLYVTGVLIGSVVGDTYPFKGIKLPTSALGGTSSGFGIAASRVIISNIAAEIKGK